MKLRNLLYLLLALPMLMVACNKDGDDTKQDPTVSVTAGEATENSLTFSVDVKGGDRAAWVVFEGEEPADIFEAGTPVNANKVSTVVATDLKRATYYTIVAAVEGNGKVVKSAPVKMLTLGNVEPTPTPTPDQEYTLAAAERIQDSEIPANLFAIIMVDDTESVELMLGLEGKSGDTTLQAGKYTVADGTINEESYLVVYGDNEAEYRFDEGSVEVGLEGEIYTFDIWMKDNASSQNIHLTYEGVVLNMEPQGQPETEVVEPLRVTAELFEPGNFALQLWVSDSLYHELDMYDLTNPNSNYLTSGHYSMKDGSIGSDWSIYAYTFNGNDVSAKMTAAEIDLKINDDNSVSIKGSFASEEGHSATIDWKGNVEGFNFEPQGDPTSFDVVFSSASYLQTSSYNDAEIYQFRNEAGFQANIHFEKSKAKPLTPGRYTIADYVTPGEFTYAAADSRITILDGAGEKVTGQLITAGDIVVEVVDEAYKISFDLTINYNGGVPFKASFEGTIANDTVWTEGGNEPELDPIVFTSAELIAISGGTVDLKFTDSNCPAVLYLSFYTSESYLPAATYKPGMPAEGVYSVNSYVQIAGEQHYYNLDLNSLDNTVVVELADDNTYSFTFNNLLFGDNITISGSWSGLIEGLGRTEGGEEFTPDYIINEWMWAGYSSVSWGNYYNISGDGISMQVHFCQDVAQESSLQAGDYTWTSTTGIGNDYPERFALRSVTIGGSSVTIKGGTITVANEGDTYTINLTLNSDSQSYKLQFVGKLNEAYSGGGGNEGGDDTSSKITLTSLTYTGYNTTAWFEYFTLSDGGSTSLEICFNEYQANSTKIYDGEYDWITISQVAYEYGYFATNNVVINGVSKRATSGSVLNVTNNEGVYTLDLKLKFDDGSEQELTYTGALN